MLFVPMDRLKPGDVTATPVGHPQRPGSCLLQQNVALTDSLIGRLREMMVQATWVHREGFEDLDARIGTHVPALRTKLYEFVSEKLARVARGGVCKEDFDRYCEHIGVLVAGLYENGGPTGIPSERLFTGGDELTQHTAEVVYLSVMVARSIQEYVLAQRGQGAASGAAELAALGASAMLHDVAKVGASKDQPCRHAFDHCEEQAYLDHPVEGFRLLSGKVNALAGAVCLQHHQRWDGEGWPDMTAITRGRVKGGLAAENIHIYARIVAVANALDALTLCEYDQSGRVRPILYGLSVLQSPDYWGAFDPTVLSAFLNYAQAFPVGVEVVLNNGMAAGVVNQGPDPCRPVIRLEDGMDLHLDRNPDLHIASSQGFKVSEWLFDKPAAMRAVG